MSVRRRRIPAASVAAELDGGRGGEPGGEEQADRGGDREPGVRMVEQDVGRRERVEREEPGAGDQRERDQEQPRVGMLSGRPRW